MRKVQNIQVKILKDYFRHDIVSLLKGNNNIGVELGVAEGIFSERMVRSGKFRNFIGIDMYSNRGHDINQFKRALRRVGIFSQYKLLRMTFKEALDLFEDRSLDFIYIDGYAHTGEEGGETIFKWLPKVKIGGIIAGDDYHKDWPLVIEAVNDLIKKTGFELLITDKVEKNTSFCKCPSWVIIKKEEVKSISPSKKLIIKGKIGKHKKELSLKKKITKIPGVKKIYKLFINKDGK